MYTKMNNILLTECTTEYNLFYTCLILQTYLLKYLTRRETGWVIQQLQYYSNVSYQSRIERQAFHLDRQVSWQESCLLRITEAAILE